jgi:hypothetical protein
VQTLRVCTFRGKGPIKMKVPIVIHENHCPNCHAWWPTPTLKVGESPFTFTRERCPSCPEFTASRPPMTICDGCGGMLLQGRRLAENGMNFCLTCFVNRHMADYTRLSYLGLMRSEWAHITLATERLLNGRRIANPDVPAARQCGCNKCRR